MDKWKDVVLDLQITIEGLTEDVKKLQMDLDWEKNKRKQAEEERDNALRKAKDNEVLLSEYARTIRRITT